MNFEAAQSSRLHFYVGLLVLSLLYLFAVLAIKHFLVA